MGHLAVKDKLLQARNAKWCNKDMQTMHMGHQPMILADRRQARTRGLPIRGPYVLL